MEIEKKVQEILAKMSKGQRKYEEKKAKKLGFASIEAYIQNKLEAQFQTRITEDETKKIIQLQNETKKAKEAGVWKQTDKAGQPYFSLNYHMGTEYRVEGRTNNSYEMMEWFLKTIGHLNPHDLPVGGNLRNLPNGEVSLDYIDTCLQFLFGKLEFDIAAVNRGASSFVKDVDLVSLPNEPFQWFAELEHLITNDNMFWTLFEFVWTGKSQFFTDATLERYGRLDIPLKQRMECGEILKLSSGHSNYQARYKGEEKFLAAHFYTEVIEDYLNEDEEITIYRSFKVAKGQPIRKGIYANNPEAHIHLEGNGWSYSLTKYIAHRIGRNMSTFLIKKYCGVNQALAERMLENNFKQTFGNLNETFYNNFYSCIGEFTVSREDIIYITDYVGEDEIIVNPKHAKLRDYRFLNIVDTVAIHLTTGFLAIMRSHGVDRISYDTQFINNEGVFDFFWMKCKRYFQHHPKRIKQYMKDPNAKWFRNLVDVFLNELKSDLQKHPKRKTLLTSGSGVDSKALNIAITRFNHKGKELAELHLDGFPFPELKQNSVRQRTRYTKKDYDRLGQTHLFESAIKKQESDSLIQAAIEKTIKGN